MVSGTARAAAQLTGLPPNVEPWSPLTNTEPYRPTSMQALIGRPPKPFASVSTSGEHAFMLMREPGACPADPALYLVQDKGPSWLNYPPPVQIIPGPGGRK